MEHTDHEDKAPQNQFTWRGAIWGFIAYLIVVAIVAVIFFVK
jgi:hypothetical protein